MTNPNLLTLKSINELLEYRFFIPSYQRGYRWTKKQVVDLLDDLYEFTLKDNKSKEEFYCLQPVVVTPLDDKFIVIDGQQRLTTIYIILNCFREISSLLAPQLYSLEYETRPGSEAFLKQIEPARKNENIDYYHFCQAQEAVQEWFASRNAMMKLEMLRTLLNDSKVGSNVRVIWYEVREQNDLIDIFTRLNVGKIPLTNAELIKALLLSSAYTVGKPEVLKLRQQEIAREWDDMELALQDDEFWYFLNEGTESYDTRIEFIFELMTEAKADTFRFFIDWLNRTKNINEVWAEVKATYQTLRQWFEHREWFHLVGYLIATGTSIRDIISNTSGKTKTAFKDFLIQEIRDKVKYKVKELNYEEDKQAIRRVLLLFNIVSLINNSESNARFQFGRYKKEQWDIEHIHAVQSEMPGRVNHQNDWLKEVLAYTKDQELREEIAAFFAFTSVDRNTQFEKLYSRIVQRYSEEGKMEDINDLSNLTLLDAGTNRSYKNAVFPIKRQRIIQKDESTTFIPLCTKHVFLKYYNQEADGNAIWRKEDRNTYLTAIENTLQPFLPAIEN